MVSRSARKAAAIVQQALGVKPPVPRENPDCPVMITR